MYLDGRMQAVEMLELGWSLRDMLRFAQLIMDTRHGDAVALGFRDAVIARC